MQINTYRRLYPAAAAFAIFVAASTLTRAALALWGIGEPLDAATLARSFLLGFAFDLVAAARTWSRRTSSGSRSRPLRSRASPVLPRRDAGCVPRRLLRRISCSRSRSGCSGRSLARASIHRRRLPALYPRGAGQHLAVLPDRQAAGCACACSRRVDRAAGTAAVALVGGAARLGGRPWPRCCCSPPALAVRRVSRTATARTFPRRTRPTKLAGNGLHEFFSALRRNELSFERYYATLPPAEALAIVRGAFADAHWVHPERDGIERFESGTGNERRLNVILVSIESLGAEFLGAYGDPRGLTPNLDRLGEREPLVFPRLCDRQPHGARPEALALALPPTPGQSIVRRPNNEKLFSLGSVFEDKELRGAVRLRRLRLLRQQERLLRRQRLPRGRPAQHSVLAHRIRKRVGRPPTSISTTRSSTRSTATRRRIRSGRSSRT